MHVVGFAFVAIAAALFVGASLQGIIGFGMVILAFPVIGLVEPAILPESTLIASLPMIANMAWRNRGGAIWSEVGWFTLGRPVGLIGALGLLALLDRRALTLAGGGTVLAAIALSLWAPRVPRRPSTLMGAGTLSALFGTAIAIGGPPIGLLYQHEEGTQLRSTVSAIMIFGSPLSLAVLALGGRIDSVDIRTGLALMPFVLVGNLSAAKVIPYFDQRLRPLILSVCAIAAIGAMVRAGLS